MSDTNSIFKHYVKEFLKERLAQQVLTPESIVNSDKKLYTKENLDPLQSKELTKPK